MAGLAQLPGLLLLVTLFFGLHPSPQDAKAAKPDSSSVAELVGRAVANYKNREAQLDNYTYLAHVVRTEFDRHSHPTDQITGTDEIMFLEGAPYRRVVLLNGRPLSAEQLQQRDIILEGEARARRAGHNNHPVQTFFPAPIAQLPQQFRLRRRGKQILDGREVLLIEALPDDQHQHAGPDQEYASHFKMKLWIDVTEAQIVRAESEVVRDGLAFERDAASFLPGPRFSGITTYRIEIARGSVAAMQWTKVNNEDWLPQWSSWKTPRETFIALSPQPRTPLSARDRSFTTYSDYKKFRVGTRIMPR